MFCQHSDLRSDLSKTEAELRNSRAEHSQSGSESKVSGIAKSNFRFARIAAKGCIISIPQRLRARFEIIVVERRAFLTEDKRKLHVCLVLRFAKEDKESYSC